MAGSSKTLFTVPDIYHYIKINYELKVN